jgi:hypothetical protein
MKDTVLNFAADTPLDWYPVTREVNNVRNEHPDKVKSERTRMKTTETTERVSSHGVEKRAERHKCQRSDSCAREKPRADWKKDLRTCGAGRKS